MQSKGGGGLKFPRLGAGSPGGLVVKGGGFFKGRGEGKNNPKVEYGKGQVGPKGEGGNPGGGGGGRGGSDKEK